MQSQDVKEWGLIPWAAYQSGEKLLDLCRALNLKVISVETDHSHFMTSNSQTSPVQQQWTGETTSHGHC
jgi:hypothetical protein